MSRAIDDTESRLNGDYTIAVVRSRTPTDGEMLRDFLMERRRALYLELDKIEKLLVLPRKGK